MQYRIINNGRYLELIVLFEDKDDLLKQLFYPNARVTLEFVAEKNMVKSYQTTVEDLEKEYLVLHCPLDEEKPVYIEEGRELTLWCEMDRDEIAYVTSVFVVETRKGEMNLLVCCKPQKFQRSSLRRYTRFEVDLACTIIASDLSFTGRLIDISLGGCCIDINSSLREFDKSNSQTTENLAPGTSCKILVSIPGQPELVFTAEATRFLAQDNGKRVGLAFEITEISGEKRELLKDFLFQCQLMNQ